MDAERCCSDDVPGRFASGAPDEFALTRRENASQRHFESVHTVVEQQQRFVRRARCRAPVTAVRAAGGGVRGVSRVFRSAQRAARARPKSLSLASSGCCEPRGFAVTLRGPCGLSEVAFRKDLLKRTVDINMKDRPARKPRPDTQLLSMLTDA
jgi:hypothetical protein